MSSIVVLYATATLIAFVAVAVTALRLAWSISSWRRRLARIRVETFIVMHQVGILTGWLPYFGSGWIPAGLAACAVIAWYSTCGLRKALIVASL